MKLIKITFLIHCLILLTVSCQNDLEDRLSGPAGIHSFKLKYADITDGDTGETIQSRSTPSMPTYMSGYFFTGNTCTQILSKEQLGYSPQTGEIHPQMISEDRGTLYLFATDNLADTIVGVQIGYKKEEFLSLVTPHLKEKGLKKFYTGEIEIDPLQTKKNQIITLQKSYATLHISRSAVFDIQKIEIRHANSQQYYFPKPSFEIPFGNINQHFTPDSIDFSALDINLAELYESQRVKITVYGTMFDIKTSLDFFLPEIRRNNQYTLKVEAPGISNPENRKFMVVAIAGQSNATGYDESPVDLHGEESPVPHVYQLGMKTSKDKDFSNNLKILPMDFCPQDMYDMRPRFRTKKLHLPLGKELLKRIPKGYEVVVIDVTRPASCVTFEGCRAFGNGEFVTAKHNHGLGFYDQEKMLPTILNSIYYWHENSAYNKMLSDRIKYVLDMNPENRFLGVVWCQGENDSRPGWVRKHYDNFEAMTDAFFRDLNETGYGERCPQGTAGKHIWYNFTSTLYWLSFQKRTFIGGDRVDGGSGLSVFGGYKVWNPDTFVRPSGAPEYTNETNGDGRTIIAKASHYGNGAYHKLVAPMLVECMDLNGGLFNGKIPQNNRYTYQISREEAQGNEGQITDSDIQDGLIFALPFDDSNEVTKNLAQQKQGVTITNNGLTVEPSAFKLPSISGERTANTLKLERSASKNIQINLSGKDASAGWSASCMLKRTGQYDKNIQIILGNGQNNRTPYMAFHSSSTKEICGPYIEFMASPARTNQRDVLLLGSFHNADRLRSFEDWAHYGVVYDARAKTLAIYINGEQIESYTFDTSELKQTSLQVPLYIGGTDNQNQGMEGEVSDFFFWNKPISKKVMQKIYLRSYWGYGRGVDEE